MGAQALLACVSGTNLVYISTTKSGTHFWYKTGSNLVILGSLVGRHMTNPTPSALNPKPLTPNPEP